ncbi:MAG: twin-arginine translocation signal domain-containing protein, partial [Bacteroidaceae bacterium]|nr:twin-arginine translocation signal domain-containing protein [Bacteroidaceae bacterium]
MEEQKHNISRRSFLKKMGAGVVATAAVMTACKPSANNPTTTIVTQEPPKGKMTMRTLG